MKRFVELFENFGQQTEEKNLWIVWSEEPESYIQGIFASKQDADLYRKELKSHAESQGYDPDEDLYGEIFYIRKVDANDVDAVSELYDRLFNMDDDSLYSHHGSFAYANQSSVKDLMRDLILLGIPLDAIVQRGKLDVAQVIDFFDGDLDRMPIDSMPEGPLKAKLMRMKRGKQAFGM